MTSLAAASETTKRWARWTIMGVSTAFGGSMLFGIADAWWLAWRRSTFDAGLVAISLLMLGVYVLPAAVVFWALYRRLASAAVSVIALMAAFFVMGEAGAWMRFMQKDSSFTSLPSHETSALIWEEARCVVIPFGPLVLAWLSYRIVQRLGKRYLDGSPSIVSRVGGLHPPC